MKRFFSAGGVVIGPDGRIAVVQQKTLHGLSWSLPKGGINPNEDHLSAARREIEEETGLTELELVKPLSEYSRSPITQDGKVLSDQVKTITMFLFRTDEEKLQPLDPENPEARWVEPDQVEALLTHPADQAFFAKIKDQITSA